MTINPGDRLPQATFKIMGKDKPEEISTEAFFSGRKIVLFGVPGAFTPTCHRSHLPGFLDNLDVILSKGVDEVAVVSVNDAWVMDEWARATKGEGKIAFLADGNADFARAIGLDADMSAGGMGVRIKRFSMIVDDATVTSLNLERAPGKAEVSGAAAIIDQL